MNGYAVYGIMLVVIGLIFWRRTRAMYRPIKGSGFKILLPILYLLPVFSVFFNLGQLQLKMWEIGVASLLGVLLAIPLVLTTNYEIRQDGQIYAQKNKAFFIALIAVVLIRIVARQYISGLDPVSLSMLIFIVAFSYVVPWRITSFVKFRKIKQFQGSGDTIPPMNI